MSPATRGLLGQLLPSVRMSGEERRLCETGGCGGDKWQYGTVYRTAPAPDSADGAEAPRPGDIAAVHRRDSKAGVGKTVRLRLLIRCFDPQNIYSRQFSAVIH